MKRKGFLSLISLILAVAMVITALFSCSADNSSLILCNVKLEEDEESRRLTSTVSSNTISATAIYYHPEYLGTGNSYSEINSAENFITDNAGVKYILYNDGILLSQGLWNIKCIWKDKEGSTVLEGETGPTWINLNTEKLYVRFGECSLSLTYSVTCKETISPYIILNLYSFENGSISSSALSDYENKILTKVSSTTVSTETTASGTVKTLKHSFSYDFSSFNQAGSFVIVLQIKDTNDNDVLFTDIIGFVTRLGNTTTLKGSCEIEDNKTGGSCIYLPDVSDPTDPLPDEVVTVDNNETTTDISSLNKVTIEDNKVYEVTPDSNSDSNNPSMNLGHTNDNNEKSERIVIDPDGAEFGINLKGSDVTLTTLSDGAQFYESSAIVILNSNSNMTLFNHASSPRDATWAYMQNALLWPRRFEANTLLKGGTLNIVGINSPSGLSNAKVYFRGPVATDSDNSVTLTVFDNTTVKQGAINIYSPGGVINLDGDVQVDAAVGISSWTTSKTNGSYTSTIESNLDCTINIENGASIFAVGDKNTATNIYGKPIWKDTAAGIYILGNTYEGSIKIVLDNGHISATGSGDNEEAGIRIENFNGTIEIELKNGSTISSTSGTGIKLTGCPNFKITKDSTSSISGDSNAFVSDYETQKAISTSATFSRLYENGEKK